MRWFRSTSEEPLPVAMTAVRMGDRLLVIGCSNTTIIAQLALKPGLTGRACAVDEDAAAVARAGAHAVREGALLETETAPHTRLPYDDGSFDVVVLNHAVGTVTEPRRAPVVAEARRVLREGGRCVAIEAAARGGLARLIRGGGGTASADIERALTDANFRAVRTLAEREGLAFVEGAKRT